MLAKALLYICLKHQSEDDDDTVIPVPEHIREKIRAAYNILGLEEDQPIKKVPLHVYNINELLMIDELATS